VTTFVFSLIPQVIQLALSLLARRQVIDYEITLFFTMGIFMVTTFLVFVVFYFMGKKVDLSLELGSTIVALFVGNSISYLIGQTSQIILEGGFTAESVSFLIITSLFYGFMGNFFAALAALAVANIRRNKSEPVTSQSAPAFS
jgi:hypothetical protein